MALTEWRLRPGVKTRRADILLVIYDYYGEVRGVIGVENKVGARELPNQVSDYQEAISKRFWKKDIQKLMLFLSPEGKESETANKEKNYDCPYTPISYQQIQAVCDKISKMANVAEQPRFNETWEWVNLWQGDKYCLQDLGKIDAEQMFQKLTSRIEDTKDAIDKKILEFRQYDKANTHI